MQEQIERAHSIAPQAAQSQCSRHPCGTPAHRGRSKVCKTAHSPLVCAQASPWSEVATWRRGTRRALSAYGQVSRHLTHAVRPCAPSGGRPPPVAVPRPCPPALRPPPGVCEHSRQAPTPVGPGRRPRGRPAALGRAPRMRRRADSSPPTSCSTAPAAPQQWHRPTLHPL